MSVCCSRLSPLKGRLTYSSLSCQHPGHWPLHIVGAQDELNETMTCLLLESGESSERAAQAPEAKALPARRAWPHRCTPTNSASTSPSPAMAGFACAHGPEGSIHGRRPRAPSFDLTHLCSLKASRALGGGPGPPGLG